MLRAYKVEIDLVPEQKETVLKTIGVARYVKNMYIAHNQEVYANGGKFVGAMAFSKWLNGTFLPTHPEMKWIKEVSSKSIKQSLLNTEKAYKVFFKGKAKYPKFAKKNQQRTKMYFVKNDAKSIIQCERHRIRIPTLGWVKLKEKGYIPTHSENHIIKSGTISQKADRFYVSVLVQERGVPIDKDTLSFEGIGIDLGLSRLAICSNRFTKENINNSPRMKKLQKQLRRAQRQLSRKYEAEKRRIKQKIIKKGESTRKNIQKQILKVQKLHHQIARIREDLQNKFVAKLVRTKPDFITMEDLNIKGMMKNKHLSKAIGEQGWYAMRMKIAKKCQLYGIEFRIVHRFYPSSKLCHNCGSKKIDLKLSDRIFTCDNCDYREDRDFNASLNLRDAKVYKIIV